MSAAYSEAFIEQALVKVFSRGTRSIRSVAQDLNVSFHTLKYWMTRKMKNDRPRLASGAKRPGDWSRQEQLVALHETHGLSGEALQAWCRERGVFTHQLEGWRSAFCMAITTTDASSEARLLKDENVKLKRELARKEKALAEAAALLVLQKKFRALWEDEDK